MEETKPFDFDVMLEIRDKEKSAIRALDVARHDLRVRKMLENVHGVGSFTSANKLTQQALPFGRLKCKQAED